MARRLAPPTPPPKPAPTGTAGADEFDPVRRAAEGAFRDYKRKEAEILAYGRRRPNWLAVAVVILFVVSLVLFGSIIVTDSGG